MRRLVFLLIFSFFIFPVRVFAGSSLEGRVIFKGKAPASEKIEIKSEIGTCGNKKEIQPLVLGKQNGVANAVVTLIGVPNASLPVPKDGHLDQARCEYEPHVQVLPVGSGLKISSNDPIVHNAHGFNEDGTTAFNVAFPVVGTEITTKIKQAGVIHVRCDAGHTWMSAYIIGVNHPYYALTDADGNFKIENVPPGSYEIEIWQEWLGKHREPVTIKPEGSVIEVTLKK